MSENLDPTAVTKWVNCCRLCNDAGGTRHSSTECCLICRNFETIDSLAILLTLDVSWVKGGKIKFEELFKQLSPKTWKDLGLNPQTEITTMRDALQAMGEPLAKLSDQHEKALKQRDATWAIYESKLKAFNAIKPEHGKFWIGYKQKEDEANRLGDIHTELVSKYNLQTKKDASVKSQVEKAKKDYDAAREIADNMLKAPVHVEYEALAAEVDRLAAEVEQTRKDPDAIQELMMSASTMIVKKIATRLMDLAEFDRNDPITRARFFFTWIANTIKYEENPENVEKLKALRFREPILTLATGYEVCRGYAKLFNAMFNSVLSTTSALATNPPDPGASLYISGHAKQSQTDVEPHDGISHAWNAFPISPGVYKIIDCCWGAGNVNDKTGSPFDPSWFTKPNEEFLRNHIPAEQKQQFVTTTRTSEKLWIQKLASFSGSSQGYRISKLSVQPSDIELDWTRNNQEFVYRKSCRHILPSRMPTYVLNVYNKEKESTQKDGLQQQAENQIWFTASKNNGEDIWRATVDLTQAKYRDCDAVRMRGMFWPIPKEAQEMMEARLEGKRGDFKLKTLSQLPSTKPVIVSPEPIRSRVALPPKPEKLQTATTTMSTTTTATKTSQPGSPTTPSSRSSSRGPSKAPPLPPGKSPGTTTPPPKQPAPRTPPPPRPDQPVKVLPSQSSSISGSTSTPSPSKAGSSIISPPSSGSSSTSQPTSSKRIPALEEPIQPKLQVLMDSISILVNGIPVQASEVRDVTALRDTIASQNGLYFSTVVVWYKGGSQYPPS